MGDQGPGTKWIAPEDVPDPVALRGIMVPRERPTLPDPMDPPSLEAVNATARTDETPAPAPEPAEFTLEPTPPPAAHVDRIVDPPGRRLPAAVWVGGTLLAVALLSMGIRLLTVGAGAVTSPPVTPRPDPRPPVVAPAVDPVPVDAAPAPPVERPVAPRRARERKEIPPQASLRPTGGSAPPAAVVRPITPVEAASLEPDPIGSPASPSGKASAPTNPWSEVEP